MPQEEWILLATGSFRRFISMWQAAAERCGEECRYRFASISINGAQQADGEGAGRPKSSASRDVGEADDFKWTQPMKLDGLPHDRMQDLAGVRRGNAPPRRNNGCCIHCVECLVDV